MSPRGVSAAVRQRVAIAARFRCGYCLTAQRIIGPLLEIDHIIPEARGGTSVEENLWLACPMCNSHKADRQEALDPESRAMVALFNPRAERWEEHFEWIEAGTICSAKLRTLPANHAGCSASSAARRLASATIRRCSRSGGNS
jgi:5-methylcytosine-specific restriction endonuclease McrA